MTKYFHGQIKNRNLWSEVKVINKKNKNWVELLDYTDQSTSCLKQIARHIQDNENYQRSFYTKNMGLYVIGMLKHCQLLK